MNAAGGAEKAYKDYIGGNLIGTPEQLIEKHSMRKSMVGDYEIIANFSLRRHAVRTASTTR